MDMISTVRVKYITKQRWVYREFFGTYASGIHLSQRKSLFKHVDWKVSAAGAEHGT
jgi:hypothetical protein